MRINRVLFGIILASVFSTTIFGEPKEIILQNGLEGYTGCSDTYIQKSKASSNFVQSKTLEVLCEGS